MADIPVISSHVLHGLPAFIRREMGETALLQANRAVGLDLELIEDENCFIPHAAVLGFVEATARAAGEANFGVLIAPMMNVTNYGSYGRYVFGANTLGQAIERAISGLRFHSTDDRMSVAIVGDEVRHSYVFALAGRTGWGNTACAAAGVLLSLFRAYRPLTGDRCASSLISTGRMGLSVSKMSSSAPSFSTLRGDRCHGTPSFVCR